MHKDAEFEIGNFSPILSLSLSGFDFLLELMIQSKYRTIQEDEDERRED
jgi:hypothetical protein